MTEAATGDVWTVRAALDWTVGYLERKGDENPRLSAEWLLAEACRMRRVELYVSFDRPLSMGERDVLREYVSRRGAGEPLQYITGEAAFRHIAVKVHRGVLIPRPETEVLVSEGLALLPSAERRHALDSTIEAWEGDLLMAAAAVGEEAAAGVEGGSAAVDASLLANAADPAEDALLIADLCTGTGCVACSIAYEHPLARVVATDIAPEAVALARENVETLGLADRVRVLECDLAAKIGPAFDGRFDLVISNPPYVPTSVLADIPREVADFEPALALDGGDDGNDILRRILPEAMRLLKDGGALAVELHETRLNAAADLACEAGFSDIRIVRDLADRPRVLTCRKERGE